MKIGSKLFFAGEITFLHDFLLLSWMGYKINLLYFNPLIAQPFFLKPLFGMVTSSTFSWIHAFDLA